MFSVTDSGYDSKAIQETSYILGTRRILVLIWRMEKNILDEEEAERTGPEVGQRPRIWGAAWGKYNGSRTWGEGLKQSQGLPLFGQQMPKCDSQLANNRAEEAEGKRHSWGVRPSDRGAEGGRAGPSWDTRGVRRGVGVADG